MTNKVTARPCKESPSTWEILDQYGCVRPKHYQTKDECVKQARKLAEKCGCELCIEDQLNRC